MNADEYQQQQDEYHQLVIASGEHQRDLVREDFNKRMYPVKCWVCGATMRHSQWPGMRSRHADCA